MNNLNEVFFTELSDIYHAENQLLKTLPKMAKAARAEELKNALTEHCTQTEGQVERLRKVFQAFGKPARGKKCKGMEAILEEGKEFISELEEGPALDAAIIGSAQKVEHYEIASYGTLRTWAQTLNNEEAGRLLQETLQEEELTDRKLTEIAERHANPEAVAA